MNTYLISKMTSMRKVSEKAVALSKLIGFILGRRSDDNRGKTWHKECDKSAACSWSQDDWDTSIT